MIFDLILFCAGMLVIFLMKLSAQDKTKLLEKVATVKRHLATIFEKLNINSRRELAEGKL